MTVSVHGSNTHGKPNSFFELESFFGDALKPYISDGALPTVPASSRTLAAFATAGYVRGSDGELVYVTQPAISLTLANTNGVHWLAIHESTSAAVSSWTRRAGSHYIFRQVTSQPANPTGGLVFAKVTIAAGIITAVDDYRIPLSLAQSEVYDPLDPLYGAAGDGITDDTIPVQAAVTAAANNGRGIVLLQNAFLTTASLTSFHTVRKVGPGSIIRGSDTFYVVPTSAQSNSLYVATTGNNASDGLTSSQPVATLAQALTILKSYGPSLNGTWTIKLAAGTYSEGNIDFPVILGNLNRVVIQGVIVNHPNVPTTIFDGTTGAKAYFLNFNSAAYATVSNIKVQNYTTYGIVAQDMGDVICVNIHGASLAGATAIKMQQGRLRVQGGILTACQVGITIISGCTYTIGDPAGASTAGGTQITNCTQAGILVQENSTGHADFCTIDTCPVGIDVVVSCRVHAQGCVITNSVTAGVRCRQDSSWFDNGTAVNFAGNTSNELLYSFSGEVTRDGPRTSELRQPIDLTLITTTGVFANAVVKTYANALTFDSFVVTSKAYRVIIYGTITGTVNSKNIAVDLAGSPAFGFTVLAAVVGDFVLEGIVYANGASAQSFWATLQVEAQACRVQQGSRSIAMVTGANIPMTIRNTVNGAGDTIVIRGVDQYAIGGV